MFVGLESEEGKDNVVVRPGVVVNGGRLVLVEDIDVNMSEENAIEEVVKLLDVLKLVVDEGRLVLAEDTDVKMPEEDAIEEVVRSLDVLMCSALKLVGEDINAKIP